MNLRGGINGWELPVSNCQFSKNDATDRARWNEATMESPLEHDGEPSGSIMNLDTQLNLLKENPCGWVRRKRKQVYE
jgi:hypothetical protein